jgi:hypothetical protein
MRARRLNEDKIQRYITPTSQDRQGTTNIKVSTIFDMATYIVNNNIRIYGMGENVLPY